MAIIHCNYLLPRFGPILVTSKCFNAHPALMQACFVHVQFPPNWIWPNGENLYARKISNPSCHREWQKKKSIQNSNERNTTTTRSDGTKKKLKQNSNEREIEQQQWR